MNSNVRAGSSPALSTRKLQTMFGAFFIINYFKLTMGTFVISKRFNDEYKFEFTSRKGKTIFTSHSFELKFECEEEIEQLKTLVHASIFLKVKTSKGKYFFRLLLNEKLIAVSRKYSTELLLQKGIEEIKRYTLNAEVLDFSSDELVFPEIDMT